MKIKKYLFAFAILALAGLASAIPALAQSAEKSEGWTFQLMPYFWASGIKTEITAPIGQKTIDLSFSDILENIHFGAMGSFEGRKGRWGFLFDGGYADIRKTVSVSGDVIGEVEAKTPTTTVALVATGRVVQGKMVLELLAGPRYNWSKTELTVKSGLAAGLQHSSTDSWWDAIAGARLFVPLAKSWMLYGYGDVGGGGSKLTWQAKGAVAWRFSRVLSAEVGYRHFSFERVNKNVSNKQAKSGFYLGLGIWF
jgi:hypothetical protein